MSKEPISEHLEEALLRLDRLVTARAKKNAAIEQLAAARDEAEHADNKANEAINHERKMEEEFAAWLESQAQRFALLELEKKQKGE